MVRSVDISDRQFVVLSWCVGIMALALVVAGQAVEGPTVDADVAATFKELGAKFKLDDKVIDHLVKTEKMESLEEFSRSATSEQEVGDIIKNITGLENLLQQTSRLRMAWTAIRAATEKSVVIKKRDGEADDLDKLLPQGDLDDLHELFWNRHRLTYEPDDEPANGLMSRLHREIYRRLLTVRDVWATKCLIHQVKSEKKRTQLAEGLDLVHTEMAVELPCKHNVVNFLHLHAAMMLAYAKAGIKRRPDAPQQEPGALIPACSWSARMTSSSNTIAGSKHGCTSSPT